ncbi:two component transcriptional regulator, LytTR family [Chitinophaga sp. YR573]|uniref:LytR/AlgR family response regulator transcription factor n=1 Tax=Chitinophaga sp. YR573 TaxID=1881040 RepID=UPI0008C3CF41|nr:LytTR family DNA-binding domain-containing protein [Chitinophaga sp. YR573]SEW40523.1 two component transcriptional regulator, LytTR family [Chitinophaga sp. YR573]
MKVVIIEDEKVTAKDLKRTILEVEPDIEIDALLHSVEDAIEYFANHKDTDLIFSDIQLGDGLSFEIFKKMENQVPIIFCTAYNSYFSEAFETTGIDYLLKPFNKDTIEKALSKYITLEKTFSRNNEKYKEQLNALELKVTPQKNAVIIRQANKIIPLGASAIVLFFIDNRYTYAYTFNHEKFIVSENLEDLEKAFAPSFFRANRQFLINRKAVKDATQYFNRKIIVNLSVPFKDQILVGKLKISSFIEWLSQH